MILIFYSIGIKINANGKKYSSKSFPLLAFYYVKTSPTNSHETDSFLPFGISQNNRI